MEAENFTKSGIDKKSVERLVKAVLGAEKKSNLELSVSFVNQEEIRKLNKKYRKKDNPTDVLSFTYKNSGEVVICPDQVRLNAKKFSSDFKKELSLVLVHGILHIIGYDHEKSRKKAVEMKNKINYYLKLFAKK